MPERVPLPYFLMLYNPKQMRINLQRMYEAGHIEEVPTLWQVFMGVLYMWNRLAFRPESIGQSTGEPVRDTDRARRLENRLMRFPYLVRERAITPIDFTGFGSAPDRIICHLLGAYHPGDNFFYDLQALSAHPGKLEELRQKVDGIIDESDPRAEFLRDLTVYEGYHERLRLAVDRALVGDFAVDDTSNSDTSVTAFVRWCCKNPPTPFATLRAALRGEISFEPRA